MVIEGPLRKQILDAFMLKERGSVAWWTFLNVLDSHPSPVTLIAADIARQAGRHRSTVSETLRGLVQEGWLARSGHIFTLGSTCQPLAGHTSQLAGHTSQLAGLTSRGGPHQPTGGITPPVVVVPTVGGPHQPTGGITPPVDNQPVGGPHQPTGGLIPPNSEMAGLTRHSDSCEFARASEINSEEIKKNIYITAALPKEIKEEETNHAIKEVDLEPFEASPSNPPSYHAMPDEFVALCDEADELSRRKNLRFAGPTLRGAWLQNPGRLFAEWCDVPVAAWREALKRLVDVAPEKQNFAYYHAIVKNLAHEPRFALPPPEPVVVIPVVPMPDDDDYYKYYPEELITKTLEGVKDPKKRHHITETILADYDAKINQKRKEHEQQVSGGGC